MKTPKEQTKRQNGLLWPFGAIGGWFGGRESPLLKATRGSGAAEGKNDYDKPCDFAGGGVGGGIADGLPAIGDLLRPWTLPRYRVMSLDPTLALAEASTLLTILAAEWTIDVEDSLADDKTAAKGKAILEKELLPKRQGILRGALQSLRYGWKDFEIVYLSKNDPDIGGFVGLAKVKELAGDFISFQVDDKGNLTGVVANGVTLQAPYFLHIVNGKEDDNWFGMSRHERIRRAWANYLHLEDLYMRLSRKGSGTTPMVGVPADDDQKVKETGKRANFEAGQAMARALNDNQAVVYYRLPGIDDHDIAANPELAKASSVGIDFVDVGNPGPALAAIDARLANLDKAKLRGWFKPERTLTEATTGGSRADSESHGDLALADAEATHESIVEQINEQLVATLIRENCGEQYVGKIRLTAVPLQDERRAALSKFFDNLMQDGGFRTSLIKAMGAHGVEGLINKLALDVHLEPDAFELEEPKPPTPPGRMPPQANEPNGADAKPGGNGGEAVPPEDEEDDADELSAMAELDAILALSRAD